MGIEGHNSTVKIGGQIAVPASIKFAPVVNVPPGQMKKHIEFIQNKIMASMCVPLSILSPPPEWAGRVIRIPESRIAEILGH